MSKPTWHSGQERREQIIALLRSADGPFRGADLAAMLGVSRQIIVQDIAVLRASGAEIVATPLGYTLLDQLAGQQHRAVLACRHGRSEVEDELSTLVDLGLRVVDVVVEHPLYGELRGSLSLASREDVREFVERLDSGRAELLSALTGGLHLHTVEAPRPELLEKARATLRARGYLLTEDDGE